MRKDIITYRQTSLLLKGRGCFYSRGIARSGHHRGDDLHLRPGERCLKIQDYYPQKKRWWVRLHENNGKVNVAGASRWHKKWRDIPTPRPPDYMTGATIGLDEVEKIGI